MCDSVYCNTSYVPALLFSARRYMARKNTQKHFPQLNQIDSPGREIRSTHLVGICKNVCGKRKGIYYLGKGNLARVTCASAGAHDERTEG